nr:MAG TPA: hypothetical protein [Caudoviricetes sp.]
MGSEGILGGRQKNEKAILLLFGAINIVLLD